MKKKTKNNKNNTRKEIILAGFFSALSGMTLIGIVYWVMDNLYKWIGYKHDDLIILFLGFTAFVGTLAILVIPPIYVGKKQKNIVAGLLTVGATIACLFLLSLMLIVVLS